MTPRRSTLDSLLGPEQPSLQKRKQEARAVLWPWPPFVGEGFGVQPGAMRPVDRFEQGPGLII